MVDTTALREATAASRQWTVEPLTATFGAALTGGALATAAGADEIAGLLARHLVLVVRGQHLSPHEHATLARRLGEPTSANPVAPGLATDPETMAFGGAADRRNARWHTDMTFMARPPAASIVVADIVPPVGGDTMWADMRAAYDRLAAPLRWLADELVAVHRITPLAYWGEPFDSTLGRDEAVGLAEAAGRVPAVAHPVVRLHPRSGHPALFVNPGFTSHILGLSRHESDALLRLLFEHSTQPEMLLRHRWQSGDVVIWDNHATMHYGVDDCVEAPRRMRRVTIAGSEAIGPSGFASMTIDDPLLASR